MAIKRANSTPTDPAVPVQPAPPSAGRSQVNVATYSNAELEKKLLQSARAKLGDAAITVGSYGYAADQAVLAHQYGAQYFPIFAPSGDRTAATPANADPRYAGERPKLNPLTPDQRLGWGKEMGMRVRDGLRARADAGDPAHVDGWQLDEIWPSMGHMGTASQRKSAVSLMDFFTGVLQGLHQGRPGDKPMTGIVHVSSPGQVFSALARVAKAGDIDRAQRFLKALADASSQIQLELYPADTGATPSQARSDGLAKGAQDVGRTTKALALLASYPALKPYTQRVIQKLSLGLTPGHAKSPWLGGNQKGRLGRAQENAFKEGYVEAGLSTLKKAGAKSPGVSEYDWVKARESGAVVGEGNENANVMGDTFQAIGTARQRVGLK